MLECSPCQQLGVSDEVTRRKRRVGIVGFGHLGKFLFENILQSDDFDLAFVWNRTTEDLKSKVADEFILTNLKMFAHRQADLIVEVAHPSIVAEFGPIFLQHADFMVGSPTALSNQDVENELRNSGSKYGLYVPIGAFWGGEDIQKMADRGTLQALKVSMTKHPDSFKLTGDLKIKNEAVTSSKTILYEGPVRNLCPLAPNNVNTMAAAAIAGHTLGFDKVTGCLIADPGLTDWHFVEVEAWGPGDISAGTAFHVHTLRKNPATVGNVTGTATYASFLSSMLRAHGRGPGVHLV